MTETINEFMEIDEDTQKDRYLTFLLEGECFGIEIKYVTEIIGIQTITVIPELPAYVKGIINLRGKIIPVIDVRRRFRKKAKEYNDRTCIIIVDIKELSVGLIVDSVAEVITIPEKDIVDPPQFSGEANNRYIKKIGKAGSSVKLLLDCERLLTETDMEELSEVI